MLSPEQYRALAFFARDYGHGRRWREALHSCWETGRYYSFTPTDERATLQSIRNTLGPSGLAKLARPVVKG